MRIVLIGPPGAGKGTQADKLAGKFAVPHISTGQLFRENVSVGTRLAMAAKHYLDADELVPSEVTNALVEARINHSDAAHGFILDAQAEALTRMAAVRDQSIDTVLQFQVCEAALLTRIKDRARADDIDEVIQSRFKGHQEQTAPLSHYHRNEVITIDGFGSIDEVVTRVLRALGR